MMLDTHAYHAQPGLTGQPITPPFFPPYGVLPGQLIAGSLAAQQPLLGQLGAIAQTGRVPPFDAGWPLLPGVFQAPGVFGHLAGLYGQSPGLQPGGWPLSPQLGAFSPQSVFAALAAPYGQPFGAFGSLLSQPQLLSQTQMPGFTPQSPFGALPGQYAQPGQAIQSWLASQMPYLTQHASLGLPFGPYGQTGAIGAWPGQQQITGQLNPLARSFLPYQGIPQIACAAA